MDNLNFLLPTEREREARLVHVPNRQFTEQHLTLNDYLSISLFVIQNLENSQPLKQTVFVSKKNKQKIYLKTITRKKKRGNGHGGCRIEKKVGKMKESKA